MIDRGTIEHAIECACALPDGAWSESGWHQHATATGNPQAYERCPEALAARRGNTRTARLERAGVPEKYIPYTKEGYRDWPGEADAFLADPRGFLCIFGGNGSGKTRCGVAILDLLAERALRVRYANAKDLTDELVILDGFGRLTEEAEAEQRACREVPILLLDDLFSESAFKAVYVRDLIERRYRSVTLGTIFTTMKNPADAARIDSDLASRVWSGRRVWRGGADRRLVKEASG